MAKKCLYDLVIGRQHDQYSPSAYRVCVTQTQAGALFSTAAKPKQLGCGTFACVYEHPFKRDRVIKITRDPSDVAGLQRAQGGPVPKLYATRKLAGKGRWLVPATPGMTEIDVHGRKYKVKQEWPERPDVYALTVERLSPLTPFEKQLWQSRLKQFNALALEEAERYEAACAVTAKDKAGAKIKAGATTCGYKPATTAELLRKVCPVLPVIESARCQFRFRELHKIVDDLEARGVPWDDLHAGNIGVDEYGNWKALDVGATTTKLDSEPPVLAGRSPRRRASRRR